MKAMVDTGRMIAACFALAAFAVAVVAGLSAGKDAAQVLLHAIIAMMLCYPVGLVAGMVCDREVSAHIGAEGASPSPIESSQAPSTPAAMNVSGQEVADPSRDQSRAAA